MYHELRKPGTSTTAAEILHRMADMTALPTRPLGRSGLIVSILGFGGAPLGDLYDLLDDDTAVR